MWDPSQSVRNHLIGCLLLVGIFGLVDASKATESYDLEVLQIERSIVTDLETGASLLFLTTDSATDTNLYFHERSWLADGTLILFYRDDGYGRETMGYVVATGELVRIRSPKGPVLGVTAAVEGARIYGIRGSEILELTLSIHPAESGTQDRSKISVEERVICALPEKYTNDGYWSAYVNENSNGTKLAMGVAGPMLITIDIETGEIEEIYRYPDAAGYLSHTQWSHTNPDLLSFAGHPNRLNAVDTSEKKVWTIYEQWPDEVNTHEHWWVDDQMVFCGGTHPEPNEDRHVKVINVFTGVTRIIGAGAWWPGGTDEEIARQNFWHCSGSDDGRWVAADNWHGDITLFEGATSRARILTKAHRNYGRGVHPHVGWDRHGRQVIFTSHKRGNPDICVATIPEEWQTANPTKSRTEN